MMIMITIYHILIHQKHLFVIIQSPFTELNMKHCLEFVMDKFFDEDITCETDTLDNQIFIK